MTHPPVEYLREIAAGALSAVDGTSFALAGAGAIREHGLIDRLTQDVDLFASSTMTPEEFDESVDLAVVELDGRGYAVTLVRRSPLFAQFVVIDRSGRAAEIDFGVDWRALPPIRLAVGPVLALSDAVGNKVAAAFSRGEVRDLLDVDAIRQSGVFSDHELLDLGREHDEGFTSEWFALQLDRASFIPPGVAMSYGVDQEHLTLITDRLTRWAADLR